LSKLGDDNMKFQRKPTIVEAIQVSTPANFGSLGALVTGDWIINTILGTLGTLNSTDFNNTFMQTSQNAELTGSDINAMQT